MFRKLSLTPCSSIRKISDDWAEQKAYYRFLNHPKVTEDILIDEAASRLQSLVRDRHLLCIQDTSEVNLTAHDKRITDKSNLGRLDYAHYALGFKIHPAFVIDAYQFTPLGFAEMKLWHRPLDMPRRFERNFRRQSIEVKESYKWIEVAQQSKTVLKEAQTVTFVQDRESDIYELFCLVPDERSHLIVRSSFDRNVTEGGCLTEQLSKQTCAGKHLIELETDKRVNRAKKTVELEIRYCKLTIKKPTSSNMKGLPLEKELYVVEAKEINTKGKDEKIYWRLLTTHKVENYEEALQIIEWYRARWYIEQLFRLLKNKGYQIENTELENGAAIRKICIMMLMAILKIMQMRLAYDDIEGEGQPIEEVFTEEEVDCLKKINEKLRGKTTKQQNQYNPNRTKWATWIIGRLGGWKAYSSQGPPGLIVLRRGLERFSYILEGYLLIKDMGTR
ncbi:MAG TPA: IS4 family transposase [Bacteroidales bacterium]|nr:IS4 family transposase [Bacteroidales bacterium]